MKNPFKSLCWAIHETVTLPRQIDEVTHQIEETTNMIYEMTSRMDDNLEAVGKAAKTIMVTTPHAVPSYITTSGGIKMNTPTPTGAVYPIQEGRCQQCGDEIGSE
jgi:hypothetical protein